MRVLFMLMATAALLVSAEEPLNEDDVDRTDFTEEHMKEDKVSLGPQGPHSEIEPASLLPDVSDGNVFVGVPNHLLVALTNSGSKMFNVSSISGVVEGPDGKRLQKFSTRVYGEPLGPREQRSFRFAFTPDEKITLGQYNFAFQVFYNDRNKDQYVDTVYNQTTSLVAAPPSEDGMLRLFQFTVGGGLLLLVLVLIASSGGSSSESGRKATKASKSPVQTDEWLSATLAGTEVGASGLKKGKPKRN